MFGFVSAWTEASARGRLAQLQEQVGRPGMAAAAVLPALTAVVDQHAAAVRDILAVGVEGSAAVVGTILLAGYARGLLDQARELGWRLELPLEPVAWSRADWVTARLLAICDLARRADEPQLPSPLI
ncbi:MAG TPA: DUF6401 family natural product biosynthesis protein [Pseudonocardiaceae bacterium]|jgi:hypothetical protein|nr:DUF6401 family natural product biosynthesis protein [Pseudonocardiaceae bacterium]